MRDALRGLAPLAGALGTLSLAACGGHARPVAAPRLLDMSASVAAAAANPVTVSPLPGTPDASRSSQISFLARAGMTVLSVQVRGSRSGEHRGVLRRYSTGTGESFLPQVPFLAGEQVSVRARVRLGGRLALARSNFTVAYQAAFAEQEFPSSGGDPRALQHYRSAPDLTPSTVTITTPAARDSVPGYLFLAPYQGRGAPGPMIVDQTGALVWFRPLPAGFQATNFQVQRYRGRPVLSWWQGRILELGFGRGEDVLLDSSYRQVGTIRAGNGYSADLHEIRLTAQGTAWIDAFDPVLASAAPGQGASASVLNDSVVQEIDVATGLVMWEWHAAGHIPASDSRNPMPPGTYPWDYAHVNSIAPGPADDLLLSFRNTWSVEDVDIHSGGLRWRLGGTRSSFRAGPGTRFYWQHDAAFQPHGRISLFDNGADPPEEKQSRGLLLALDQRTHTVLLVKAFVNPTHTLLASSQGNALSLSGGAWLLGYGGLPNFTELDRSGRVLLDGTLGAGVQNFRVSLSRWQGRPADPPSLWATRAGDGTVRVAASWNGATDVATWRVLAGARAGSLAPVASVPRTGFETAITAHTSARYVAVQALDRTGAVLGVSASATP